MSLKKMGLLAIAGILIVAGALIVFRDHVIGTKNAQAELADLGSLYEATEEIAAAGEQFQKGMEPAEIVTKDEKPHVAIVIDGLPDRTTTARLLDVLKKHGASAVFFVEGQNAANQPETIELIREAGQEIGNYTFVGIAAAQELPQERLLAEICRTQRVVEVLAVAPPKLFRSPRTVYDEELLRALRASGVECAVKESAHYAPGWLKDEAGAAAYAATVPAGSIIAIDIAVPVEAPAQDVAVEDARPAVDKQPTLEDKPAEESKPVPVDAAAELDWLLTALESTGKTPGNIHEFRKIHYVPAAPSAAVQGK